MINYLKSERYRLVRKKSLHITSIIACLLIIAFAFILDFFGRNETAFPYATSSFFYSNVISSSIFIFIIVLTVSSSLTGKDLLLLKQSISFGISRNTIFWSKLLLTLSYFLLLCLIGMLLMVGLGETLFPKEDLAMESFLIASVNMLPIVLSGFFLVHVLKMIRVPDIYTIVILIVTYTLSDDVLKLLFRNINPLSEVYKWTPSALLNENMWAFFDLNVSLEWTYWLVGILISFVALSLGAWSFNKKDFD